MHAFEPRTRDMGIKLRRRQVGMAEQQLHHPEIRAMVHKVGGEGMAKFVWRNRRLNAGRHRMASQRGTNRSRPPLPVTRIKPWRRFTEGKSMAVSSLTRTPAA